MQALTLYTSPQSRGSSVRWMLEECDADYRTISMPLAELKRPEYLAINPLGKVPALKAGETVLTETLGIITWLAEQFPKKNLIPEAGSITRGGRAYPEFWIQAPHDGQPAQTANGVHVAFLATSPDKVHAFHQAALAAGGTSDGEPGPRPHYGEQYYGCFVRDLDGHKIEAMACLEPASA